VVLFNFYRRGLHSQAITYTFVFVNGTRLEITRITTTVDGACTCWCNYRDCFSTWRLLTAENLVLPTGTVSATGTIIDNNNALRWQRSLLEEGCGGQLYASNPSSKPLPLCITNGTAGVRITDTMLYLFLLEQLLELFRYQQLRMRLMSN
jgi:hypothetical protein